MLDSKDISDFPLSLKMLGLCILLRSVHEYSRSWLMICYHYYIRAYNHFLIPWWSLQHRCKICLRGCPRGVMVKALDCRIVVCEFELQSGTSLIINLWSADFYEVVTLAKRVAHLMPRYAYIDATLSLPVVCSAATMLLATKTFTYITAESHSSNVVTVLRSNGTGSGTLLALYFRLVFASDMMAFEISLHPRCITSCMAISNASAWFTFNSRVFSDLVLANITASSISTGRFLN